ncbi:response regulator [Myxococcus sp. CA051A]|uniref:Response regulator n=2 Tax=Myxococcaceae TaxID=31 RepID=A0A540WS84_9BACT|nr:response regulator [Myxococcus sp. CA056]NTX37252.1 response regulator [Myxococcus sp. CA033]NTX53638.1 response regulator [Myxococcus sp. CA039A]NTX60134.1 response regulator [Myxococcus sp. CA051A]TQF11878.1 response regulator [Myxococcus llanfairpwllgwyngyllgogerychwyrndrobwllllantysiliogogogochensis]
MFPVPRAHHDLGRRPLMPGASEGTLLVVEDDADLRASVVDVLTSAGYRSAVAKDGLEALTWLEVHGRPSLVLLDMEMPRMDGYAFLERLARHPAWTGLTVVALTPRRVLHPAVLDTLLKPFDGHDLLERVPHWLRGSRLPGTS